MEEEGEWLVALKEALALRRPRPGETGSQPKDWQRATKAVQGPPPTRGGQKKPEPAAGKGTAAPTGAGAAAQGSAAGKKPHRPSSPRGREEDEVQVVKVQPGKVTLPTRVKERRFEPDDQRREAVPLVEGEGRLVAKKLAAGAYRVQKIIEFRKPKGRGPAQVETRWETVAAPPMRA